MYISLYISDGQGMSHPGAYVYIHWLLHRLVAESGNQFWRQFVLSQSIKLICGLITPPPTGLKLA